MLHMTMEKVKTTERFHKLVFDRIPHSQLKPNFRE
jgi:hypothetical protein